MQMDRFDSPPATPHDVIPKWVSPWGHAKFECMVREHGHETYQIDYVGIGSISAACCNALNDEFSVIDIENEIAMVAQSIAQAHLDSVDVVRERNEYRAALKMPQRAIPGECANDRDHQTTGLLYSECEYNSACVCEVCLEWEDDYEDESRSDDYD